jgi:hypothetical protein
VATFLLALLGQLQDGAILGQFRRDAALRWVASAIAGARDAALKEIRSKVAMAAEKIGERADLRKGQMANELA